MAFAAVLFTLFKGEKHEKNIYTKPMLTGLIATAFCFVTATAHASTIVLDENFDDGTNSTIESLLSSNPASLPTGTIWFSTTNANAVNLRLGTDTINTDNAGNPFEPKIAWLASPIVFNCKPLHLPNWDQGE